MKVSCLLVGLVLLAALFVDITGKKSKKKKNSSHKKAFIKRRSFKIDFEKNRFLKDGKPFQFISGDMHYFRLTRCDWMDRFTEMKYAGLNTVAM